MSHSLYDNFYLDNGITRVWCCNKCDQTHHYKTHWRIVDCLGMLCQQQTNWNTKQNILKYVNVMWRMVSLKPMLWSHFTKGAFPGSSRAVFGTPIGSSPFFFTPRGPQVTINSNLKVTRTPVSRHIKHPLDIRLPFRFCTRRHLMWS